MFTSMKDWIFMAVFGVVFLIGAEILESYQAGIGWRVVLAVVYFATFLAIERLVFVSNEPALTSSDKEVNHE